MNRYARAVVTEFLTPENKRILARRLLNAYSDQRVMAFLRTNLNNQVLSFSKRIQNELYISDVMPGITLMDQVEGFNDEFIKYASNYIEEYVVNAADNRDTYTVGDGDPTSRHGLQHYQRPANDILASWEKNARGVMSGRDDIQGGRKCGGGAGAAGTANNECGMAGGFGPDTRGLGICARGRNADAHVMRTGVTFCDQSSLGTSNHVDMLTGGEYFQMLNTDSQPHTADAFGNSTYASDQRLLNRRIFRNNEAGEENGVPRYQQRLHKSMYYMDRDVDEALRPGERDCMIHGYDMTELHRRIDHKRATRAKFEPTCADRTRLHLGANTMPTPAANRVVNARGPCRTYDRADPESLVHLRGVSRDQPYQVNQY